MFTRQILRPFAPATMWWWKTTHTRAVFTDASLMSHQRSTPNTRTLQARIVVDNPGEKLKRDMYCTVTVTAGSIPNAIAVPDASVLRDDNNQPFVYLATNANQFGRRDVEIGESLDGKTHILRGLSPGERVVGNGSLFLQFANSLQH